jgi:uncharacterized membrane protein YsdA (DUF1294 family)
MLCLLLVIPAWALSRLAPRIDWRVLLGAPVALSTFTFLAYRSDKRRAEAGEWRISESTLHLAGLIGGWPGAFLAQRKFRHKISKTSYQFAFWAVVLLHEFVAIDSLVDWKLTKHMVHVVRPQTAR